MSQITISIPEGKIDLSHADFIEREARIKFEKENEKSFWNNKSYIEVLRKLAKE